LPASLAEVHGNHLKAAVFRVLAWAHVEHLAQPEVQGREYHLIASGVAFLRLVHHAARHLGAQFGFFAAAPFHHQRLGEFRRRERPLGIQHVVANEIDIGRGERK
jgi:hypothetical protein